MTFARAGRKRMTYDGGMTRHAAEPRPNTAVRLNPAGVARIDELAEQAGVNRSEMIRRLLAAACADTSIVRLVTESCGGKKGEH